MGTQSILPSYFGALWVTWLRAPSSICGPVPRVPRPIWSLFRNLMLLSSLGLNPVSSISSRGRHRSPPGITFAPGCSLSYQGERPGATGGDKEEVPCSADAPQMLQSTSKKRPAGETEARRMAEAGPSLHALPRELYSEGSRWRAKKRGHVVLLKNQQPSLGRQPLPSTAWAQKPCPKPALQRQKQSLEALNGAQCPLLAGFYVKKRHKGHLEALGAPIFSLNVKGEAAIAGLPAPWLR